MINENKFKITIVIIIALSLVFYHASNALSPEDKDILSIYKLVQFAVMVFFVYIIIYNKYLSGLVLGREYIGGCYSGESSYYIERDVLDNATPEDIGRKNAINFKIVQNFFSTSITGRSISDSDGNVVSTWQGNLFKVDLNTYFFAIELSSGNNEFGVLKLTFDDCLVHGFYYSGEKNNKYVYRAIARKINEKTANAYPVHAR